MIRHDLFIECEVIKTKDGMVLRVFNDYFPVAFVDENEQHVHVHLPMENGAHMRFVVNPMAARASLWLDNMPATVQRGTICPADVAGEPGWREGVQEASDLRMWLRQLGRIPLYNSVGSLANLEI